MTRSIKSCTLHQIKSRRMGWAGHVARIGKYRSAKRILLGKPEGRRQFGNPGVDGAIILKGIFRRGCEHGLE
jgi:hypothetical protein